MIGLILETQHTIVDHIDFRCIFDSTPIAERRIRAATVCRKLIGEILLAEMLALSQSNNIPVFDENLECVRI